MHFLRPPAVFSLRDNYEAVAGFLAHLRAEIYQERNPWQMWNAIDFEALQRVSPAAALILAAELYRWQDFMNRRLVAYKPERWHPDVAGVLKSMGLFDFLQTPNMATQPPPETNPDIQVLKYRAGAGVMGNKCDDLLERLIDVSGPVNAENFMYDGLVEALKNAHQHAYIEKDRWFGVSAGTWFMSGSFTRSTRTLTAAVFDLGIGIPMTLPRAGFWENVRPLLQGTDDGEMIAAAMRYGRTRTRKRERGNGLPTMMRILDHHRGYLRIVSGTGEVFYDSTTRKIEPRNHNIPIGGTLIEWSISP